ncbi:FAD-dependent monooxygenase [Nocardia jinanensis]|uniref:FAD-dependent oxidoreductase n=1 Tax=Nocardia jinanensis TaxID=382504 RepID=A0A917RC24_9NOCA|nr:FAD-dependent monooxygenase [Nocardia jinanensis]GGL00147.1 FAD-dependent oxidoreductase [Nocardia jinanensis]
MRYDVIIAGAGPVGLLLACELGRAGIRPLVVERNAETETEPRANGLVGHVVPLLDRRGLYERLSGTAGPPRPNDRYFMFGGLALDLSLLDNGPVYTLPIPQRELVAALAGYAAELGIEIRRGGAVVAVENDGDGVAVELAGPDGPARLRARYLVGADGAHSVVRKQRGIDFPGIGYDRTTARTVHASIPADWVDPVTGELRVPGFGPIRPFLSLRTEHGGFTYAPFADRPPMLSTVEWDEPPIDEPMTLVEMRASITRVLGADIPLGVPAGPGPHLLRRLRGGHTRVAEQFRDGPVFLAGDAAHVYTGGGGPGLNVGLPDAVDLGWKLAAEINGWAPAGLLDSYDRERRQAATRTELAARAQSALLAPGGNGTALRAVFGELLADESTVARVAALIAGTDVRYDMEVADPHPLVGYSAPDLTLRTGDGSVRLTEMIRDSRPLLLDLAADGAWSSALTGLPSRIGVVRARTTETAATALLLRPDGRVAWATESAPGPGEIAACRAALARWAGVEAPRAPVVTAVSATDGTS